MIKAIAIGKKHEAWVNDGIERYSKRLQKPFNVEWVLLPHSGESHPKACQEESSRILTRLRSPGVAILLDETGKSYDSPALARLLDEKLKHSLAIEFIIGGAYGVSSELKQRADLAISLSSMVFPHQLVRLMLIEQIYRAQEITAGRPYHHG